MNNNNIFYQLREQTAEVKYSNGDFETKLIKPMVLEDGDQVILQKSVVDSRAVSSGNIELDNNLVIELGFYYYINNFEADARYVDTARTTEINANVVDVEKYVLTEPKTTTGNEYILEEVSFKISNKSKEGIWIGLYEYTNLDGKLITVPVPMIISGNGENYLQDPDFTTVFKQNGSLENSFKNVTPSSVLESVGADASSYEVTGVLQPGGDTIFEPVLSKISTVIEAGTYSPSDIAEIITRGLTSNSTSLFSDTFNGTINNELCLSTAGSRYTGLGTGSPCIRHTDGQRSFYYGSPTKKRWIGTSELNLQFDEIANRMKFEYLHFPYYDSSNESVKWSAVDASATENQLVSSYSGILLHSIRSIDQSTLLETDFFTTLGFNTQQLTVSPSEFVNNATLGGKVPKFNNLVIGQNLTSSNIGIDVGVDKASYNTPPAFTTVTNVTQTEPILARGNFRTVNYDSGYYLISIEGLNNDLITNTNIHRNIFGVLTTYYSSENYTSGSDADAIIYTHRGTPAYINSLRIRVLDNNYNVPENLGPDSTFFLQQLKREVPLDLIEAKASDKDV